jgi:hypothetical protein
MNPFSRGRRGRFLALVTGISLLVPLMAAPAASAAPPSRAATAQVVDRGTVVAKAAAVAARGQERPVSDHATLGRPGTSSPADGRSIGVATSRVRIADPGLVSVSSFAGIGQIADELALEPPDPWIAASSSHLVQSTNHVVRMTDRTGRLLVSLPTWALFALDPSELDADPRILWDAAHGRWVGVVMSFQPDFSLNFLNLAISEGSDPTGAWDVFGFAYFDGSGTPTLPDYPGIASSSDKIVITANEFTSDELGGIAGFGGASVLVVRWSDILVGLPAVITQWTLADTGLFSIRPSLIVGTSGVVHLVAMGAGDEVMYSRLVGTAPAVAWTNLTAAASVPGFCAANAPRQPGDPATIADAVDGRPTDAVWRANRLAFVSTCAASFDAGATFDDFVRVTILDTSLATPDTVGAEDDELLGAVGMDSFMGGIGFSGDGTLFVSFSQSSPTDYVSTLATAQYAGTWQPSILVQAGLFTYAGARWGDYVGVATDPAGSAAVWQSNQVADELGGWETQVSRLVFDLLSPTASGPNQALIAGTTVGPYTVPVRVTWTASDAGSGVARSWLYTDQFTTGLASAGAVAGTSVTRSHYWRLSTSAVNVSYQYGVAPQDGYGNIASIVTGSRLSPVVYQQASSAFSYSSGWKNSSSSSFLGGSAKYSSTAGKFVTFRASGRSFGFVSFRNSTRGKVKVYVDGVLKATVTLKSATTRARYISYVASFASSGTHTIKLVVVKGRVDVDAFVVIR